MNIKYPDIRVTLTGKDGNAFAIIGNVLKAMKIENIPKEERKKFQEEATSGDYDNVLQTAMRWVDVN